MLKVKRTCDRCGSVISEMEFNEATKDTEHCTISLWDGKKQTTQDLCDACALAYLEWLTNFAPLIKQELPTSIQENPVPKVNKSKIVLKPGTKTHHIWTEEEDDFILNHSMGMTNNDLACKFGVTLAAINSRKSKVLKQR